MRVFKNYRELQTDMESPGGFRFLPQFAPAGFECSQCAETIAFPFAGGGTGYALTPAKEMICYPCADLNQREELRDRSKPYGAYLSSDGKRVTTWTGGTLGDVIQSAPCRLTRRSFWHSEKSYRSVRVKDVHGGYWYGRGSAGVCITLRPCKGG